MAPNDLVDPYPCQHDQNQSFPCILYCKWTIVLLQYSSKYASQLDNLNSQKLVISIYEKHLYIDLMLTLG